MANNKNVVLIMQPEHQRRMRVCVRANQMDPDISVNTGIAKMDGKDPRSTLTKNIATVLHI